ncbi:hypothetical protein DSO57_1016373 [Entomophthora muscae]|uniref:Uncharacterized protein n=1 Tax=Entomophthora muscae TaxID=34485 RepID=A0ACC2RJJ6_9FUNG|nr:hypothetical protein DSO57_1016373 [Entomophthora muscae]
MLTKAFMTLFLSCSCEQGDVNALPNLEKSNLVPLRAPVVLPPAPTFTPWLLNGLVLMGLNVYFPQLSPVSSL